MRAILIFLTAILLLSACTQQKQILSTVAWAPEQAALAAPDAVGIDLQTTVTDSASTEAIKQKNYSEEPLHIPVNRVSEKSRPANSSIAQNVKLKSHISLWPQYPVFDKKLGQRSKPTGKFKMDGGCCTITLLVIAIIIILIVLFGNIGPVFTIAAGVVLLALLFLLVWNSVNTNREKEKKKEDEASLYKASGTR